MFTKNDERAIYGKIITLLETAPQSSVPTYGIAALRDFMVSWANAMNSDFEIECPSNVRASIEEMKNRAEGERERIIEKAKKEAEALINAARIHASSIREGTRQAISRALQEAESKI